MAAPPISASSCADTDGCSRGELRPYQAHSAIKTSAGRLVNSRAGCHPNAVMREAIRGGVSAAPNPKPIVCKPCTYDQRMGGNQASNTPADTGKIAPCEHPSSTCTASSAMNRARPLNKSGASGVATVARNAVSPMMTKVRRAPRRCPKTPPGIWKMAYPRTNACSSQPICNWVNPSSGIIRSAATVMLFCCT